MPRTDAAVTVVFRSRDRLSQTLDKIANKSRSTSVRVKKSLEKINTAARKTQAIMGGMMSSVAITAGLFALSMGVRRVTEEFVGMDQALTSAGAKFPEAIGKGTKAFEQLEAAARRVGSATEFTSKEAALGLEFMAMAGFSASNAISALPVVVNLATAANMDLARATDIASDALGAFNLNSKDAVTQTNNLTRISDVFARTTTSANVTLEHMFETMKDGGPVMTAAGQSVETFAALTGTLGNAGIKGSKAGTTLKNMALKLTAPVGKGAAMIKKLGLNVADSNGDMRDMLDILDDLKGATCKMGGKQRLAALDVIFGKRAIAGVNVVLGTGIDKIRAFRGELKLAAGSSEDMAEKMRKGLTNKLKVLKSSLIETGVKVLKTFQEKFPNALDDTIAAIQRFNPKPMIKGIRDLIDIGKKVFQFMSDWKPVILALGGAFVALKLALGVATVAQGALNVAMMLNPVLLIIMAIGALVVLLWYYWDEIQKWSGGVIDTMVGMGDAMNQAFLNAGIGIYNGYVTLWEGIIDLFVWYAKKAIDLMSTVGGILGFDVDVQDITKKMQDITDTGRINKKAYISLDDARMARQKIRGLPQTTLLQQAEIDAQGINTEGMGTGQKSTLYKNALDPDTLKSFIPNQTTDINVDVDFKNLMTQFDQMVTVDASAGSSVGTTQTTVNKKRAGKN